MKNKLRIIFGYLFGFITTLLVLALTILLIAKFTVFERSYVNNILEKNNYYTNVYNDIIEDIKDYNMSSGFPDELFDEIFTLDEVRNDINTFIDNAYLGKTTTLDTTAIRERITESIDEYLTSNNVEVTNDTDLESFKDEIIKIYTNQICLYKTVDGFVGHLNKAYNLINKAIIITAVIFIVVLLISIILFKVRYIDSILVSAGIMLLFIRFLIYEKIDIENILIISDNFSKILKSTLIKIGNIMFNYSVVFIIVGLIVGSTIYFVCKRKNNNLKIME